MFVLLIARFYETFSGETTYYRWLLLPVVLFGGAAVRYASLSRLTGDVFADVMFGTAGLVLIAFLLNLYRLMILRR
jgi:hypothetical protein